MQKGVAEASSPEIVWSPQKPHSLPTSLTNTPAGTGRGFESERMKLSYVVYMGFVTIFLKSGLQMHDIYSCANGN